MQVAATIGIGLKISSPFEGEACLGRWSQIGRAAHQPGNVLRKSIEHSACYLPCGNPTRIGGKRREITIPAVWQFTPLDPAQLIRQLWILLLVGLEEGRPLRVELSATLADAFLEMLSHPVRHQELLVLRPMIVALRQTDFLLAKRLAMSLTRILFMRCSVPNMAIYNDQRGAILRRLKDAKSSLQHLQVIDIS